MQGLYIMLFLNIWTGALATLLLSECSTSEATLTTTKGWDSSRCLLQMGDAMHAERTAPSESGGGTTVQSAGEAQQSEVLDRQTNESASTDQVAQPRLDGWGEAWEKSSILPAPLQLLFQVEASSAVVAFSALSRREGAAFAMAFVAIAVIIVGAMAAAFIYFDKMSSSTGVIPGLRRNEPSTAPLMQRGNMPLEPRPRRHLSPRLPGSSVRQSSMDGDARASVPRGRPPALPPRPSSIEPGSFRGDTSVPRSSLKRDASSGSNNQVRWADGGMARSSSPGGMNLLCRGLVVPPGSECVLAVPALGNIGIPPQTAGILPVRDMAGKAIVNLEVCRPDGSQRPLCALKPASLSTEPLAYCTLAPDQTVVVNNGRHEAFGVMQKTGASYTLTSERMGIRLVLEGNFAQHAVRVTNLAQLVADTQTTSVNFDSGHYYQLRAVAQSDVGLLLCALVSIDVLES
mmetsp:Transcript_43242/g.99676  ORF Transcript_43242/g.99676 Transcript_43242/m.99676 type:complete len:459 (+) Transcript_43242:156-1532(+)